MKILPTAYYNNNLIYFQARMKKRPAYGEQSIPINATSNASFVPDEYVDVISMNDRTYDSFTGLRDKHYLLSVLEYEINEAKKNNGNVAFAMFDMDNFKSVNELLGYETGDVFIKNISNSISSTAKQNNLNAYRFGGEEFIIIFKGKTEQQQKQIAAEILHNVNANEYIKSQENLYIKNAQERLRDYSVSNDKIDNLFKLIEKKKIYDDLKENFANEESKQDPYFKESTKLVDYNIKEAYKALLNERIAEEDDETIKLKLIKILKKYNKNMKVSDYEQKLLDEYLKFHYDKSPEVYQIKRWLSDFENNGGFSITGSIASFDRKSLQDKTPMNLINIAGETLKKTKAIRKQI